MKQYMIMAASAALLSSCGIYTTYHPATEVPEQLYGEEVVVSDSSSIASLNWRELFTDPHLVTLIEQGLANNTDYLTAGLRVQEAEATLLSAKLAYLPGIALAPQGTLSHLEGHKMTKAYSIPATASWEIDLFGKLRNAKRQSQALLAQSRDYQQAVRSQLIAGIANTYYTLLMLDAQLGIAEQTATSWGESARSAHALMQAGMANEAAVAQMEAAYAQVSATVLDLKEQINQVENSLSLLLAETPHAIQRGTLEGQTWPSSLSIGFPVCLLANRPDVRAAERSLEQAFYVTNQARAAFYPSITLSGSAGWTNSAGGMISNPAQFLASAVGSLTQPLFAKGQLTGQLKIAKAQQEAASLQFQQTLLQAGTEVNEALVQYQTALQKRDLYAQQVSALQTAYRSTSLLMEHGTTTYLEVLTAQQSLLSAQLTQVANEVTEIQSLIQLYRALGGGAE
ncbi:MAG: TolC family protein [Parabacteroides sp.]